MFTKLTYAVSIALEAIQHNRTRALLTSMGIIFGVASVIAMLAIGQGAQQEILAQIKLLGANNIIITPVMEQIEEAADEEAAGPEERRPFSPGLTLDDARSIVEMVPGVEAVSPEVVVETTALRGGLRRSMKLVGVDEAYFETPAFQVAEGRLFTRHDLTQASLVCIIGRDVKTKFFPKEDAVGRRIKVGTLWLTVVGVLEARNVTTADIDRLGIRDYDLDIYTPINTVLLRYENRAQLTQRDLRRRNRNQNASDNYHQIDRLEVRVQESALMRPVAEVVNRMLERRHQGVVDYQVTIPEQLLQQERQTQNIFNIVLACIASISLLVGGIGIMNIMLSSVMERIREIGVRRSMGATRRDVVWQFLIEAILISFSGGLLGIVLGVVFSVLIETSTGIATVVSPGAVLLAFLVSVSIGLVFGLLPARRAAEQDPVVALRHT
ncbi:MAG: ABC transporter permease [Bacteroidota bacterium]